MTAMILAQLTPFGWALIGAMTAAVFIAIKFIKRTSPGVKPGCAGVAYVATIYFILFLFVIVFLPLLSQRIYQGITGARSGSFLEWLTVGGCFIMVLGMFYIMSWGIAFALGRSTRRFAAVGRQLLAWFLIPVAMLFMFSVLCYAVYLHFSGQKQQPFWVIAICLLFAVALFFGCWGYLKMLTGQQRALQNNKNNRRGNKL
ncbi:hypothetical protein LL912_19470 [Niabella sp. CC-SYL272]|uniref:hypothetical protein n=1 Tax=Niabella agricola TaxID=2891571 RepID=UPI001F1B3306|nr:hypothetical protein [Niabella agricola]MCF3110975.1 hypothetical protein [Niabella agricola]